MRSIRYLNEAREEFLHEVRYFTAVSARLGGRSDTAVQKAESFIADFPEAGFPDEHGARRVFPGNSSCRSFTWSGQTRSSSSPSRPSADNQDIGDHAFLVLEFGAVWR